jgi:hypothetical protein
MKTVKEQEKIRESEMMLRPIRGRIELTVRNGGGLCVFFSAFLD